MSVTTSANIVQSDQDHIQLVYCAISVVLVLRRVDRDTKVEVMIEAPPSRGRNSDDRLFEFAAPLFFLAH